MRAGVDLREDPPMAMKIKNPQKDRPKAPTRPVPTRPTAPTRQQNQAANRPEYESQVPGLIDRVTAEKLGFPGETMRAPAGAPATTERAMSQRPLRVPVPTELKRKSKIKTKPKRGDVYVDGKRTGSILP